MESEDYSQQPLAPLPAQPPHPPKSLRNNRNNRELFLLKTTTAPPATPLKTTMTPATTEENATPPATFVAKQWHWGHEVWPCGHCLSLKYPEKNPSRKCRRAAREFFASLEHLLPCPACQQHYGNYFRRTFNSSTVDSRENLSRWFYECHADVNRRTGKEPYPVTFEELPLRYGANRLENSPKAVGMASSGSTLNIGSENPQQQQQQHQQQQQQQQQQNQQEQQQNDFSQHASTEKQSETLFGNSFNAQSGAQPAALFSALQTGSKTVNNGTFDPSSGNEQQSRPLNGASTHSNSESGAETEKALNENEDFPQNWMNGSTIAIIVLSVALLALIITFIAYAATVHRNGEGGKSLASQRISMPNNGRPEPRRYVFA